MDKIALIAALLLAACSSNSPAPPVSNGAPAPPSAWTLWFSPGVALRAGPTFDFPTWVSSCPGPTGFSQTCPSVHYLVNKSTPLKAGQTITLSFTITGNAPQWNYSNIEQDGNTCISPASVRLFFQEAGDDWSGIGSYAYYRWWSIAGQALSIENNSLTITLQPSLWSSVEGENGANSTAATAGFNQALANANTIGMTFGGGCFYGHGVDLLGGSATFTVNSFTVQ